MGSKSGSKRKKEQLAAARKKKQCGFRKEMDTKRPVALGKRDLLGICHLLTVQQV